MMIHHQNKLSLFDSMHPADVFAIIRGLPSQRIVAICEALHRGGIRFVEVTLNTPNALAMIHTLRTHFGERMIVGAGTVRTVQECVEAIQAGAQAIISPHTDPAIIACTNDHERISIPGACTPSEIMQAVHAGASVIKLFPIQHQLKSYLKELKGPFNDIPFIVMGGIDEHNVAELLNVGVFAAGAGSCLFPKHAIEQNNEVPIEDAARRLVQAAIARSSD